MTARRICNMSLKTCYILAFISSLGGKTTTGTIERDHWGKRYINPKSLRKILGALSAQGLVIYEEYGRITMTEEGYKKVKEIYSELQVIEIPRVWSRRLRNIEKTVTFCGKWADEKEGV